MESWNQRGISSKITYLAQRFKTGQKKSFQAKIFLGLQSPKIQHHSLWAMLPINLCLPKVQWCSHLHIEEQNNKAMPKKPESLPKKWLSPTSNSHGKAFASIQPVLVATIIEVISNPSPFMWLVYTIIIYHGQQLSLKKIIAFNSTIYSNHKPNWGPHEHIQV